MSWIAELRGKRTQAEIAQRAGISQNGYSNIENGRRKPSIKTAKKLAAELGCDWTKFFREEQEA